MKYHILFLFMFLTLGCYNDPKDIPGLYSSTHDKGIELLIIKNDKRFIHIAVENNGMYNVDSGNWVYTENLNVIGFDGWIDFLEISKCKICTKLIHKESLFFSGDNLRRGGENERQYDFNKKN